jgi:hypothetical protein
LQKWQCHGVFNAVLGNFKLLLTLIWQKDVACGVGKTVWALAISPHALAGGCTRN